MRPGFFFVPALENSLKGTSMAFARMYKFDTLHILFTCLYWDSPRLSLTYIESAHTLNVPT